MEELQNKLLEYLGNAEKALTDLGPKAWEATVGLVRMNAIIDLIVAGIIFIATLLITGLVLKWGKKVSTEHDEEAGVFVYGLGGFIAAVFWVLSFVALTSKGMWIALINPELGFLWEVYQKFLAT